MYALQVFDKMSKWHFLIILDSNEYQFVGITIIIHVYHDLIIGIVFYTCCLVSVFSYIGHASHMHTRCTLVAPLLHTLNHLTCCYIHSY